MSSGSAVAIGNFDGVHLGHQALLRTVIEYAAANGLQSCLLTFDPHPTVLTAPDRVPLHLMSLQNRVRFAKRVGIGQVHILPFTPKVAALTPVQFVSQILVGQLRARAVFVGENFRFAAGRAGTPEVLTELGKQFGFVSQFLPPVCYRGQVVSSTAIREHLLHGRIHRANHLLGRCFFIAGPVVSGHGIGSKQTVPTLNLRPQPGLLVPRGVYVTETFDEENGRHWHSITNAGTRPTFSGDELTIETFLLDPFGLPAPKTIRVDFRHFLRPEQAFPDAASLRSQILRDVARAQAYWRRAAQLKTAVASIY